MKSLIKHLALALIVAILVTNCAKQPSQEIDNAKAAIDAVVAERGDLFTPNELKKLNDDLQAANDEIAAQSKKFIKKYDKAKKILAKIVTDADALKAMIPARIEEIMNNALTAQNEAKAAIAEANDLLDRAPKGEGIKPDIKVMKIDLATSAETALAEIQAAIDAQDYLGARAKAVSIKAKAAAISEQVNKAFRGEIILSDATLFSKEFINDMNIKLPLWRSLSNSADRGSMRFLFPAPDPSPNIDAIMKKYGNPDVVAEKKSMDTIAGMKLKVDTTLYWYGRIGFLVAKGEREIAAILLE